MYKASSLSYSKSLPNPIDRTWMMMIILPEVQLTHTSSPYCCSRKTVTARLVFCLLLLLGLPLPKVAALYKPSLVRRAKRCKSYACVAAASHGAAFATTNSNIKVIERLEDATATVYVPARICAFFSILESEKYVSSFHPPPCKTKIPNIPPKNLHFPHPNHPPFFFFIPSTSSCCCRCSTSLGKTFVLLKYSLTLPSRTSSSFTCVAVLSPCSSMANLRARAASRLCFNRSISALISSLSKGISWVWPRLGQKSGTAKRESRLMPK